MSNVVKLTIALAFLMLFQPIHRLTQDEEDALTLSIRRDFGYGGGSKIQGTFSLRAEGPQDLVTVTFHIDEVTLGVDDEPPYASVFHTGDFDPGVHTLSAIGELADGGLLRSNTLHHEFITAAQARSATVGLIAPILVVIGLVAVLGMLVPLLFGGRKGAFQLGKYGAAGGAVCPRCSMPYARQLFSPNLIFGKLGRCPHCRKWAVVRRATTAELEGAEARYREDADSGILEMAEPEEEKMKRLLDDSRFEG